MDKKRVMIIEDELVTAIALKGVLNRNGYDVCDIVNKGSEAIVHALDLKPDLLIMDILLDDEITGIEAVEKIHEKTYIPVIYITASTDDRTLQKMQNTNMVGVLRKPFNIFKLQETMSDICY